MPSTTPPAASIATLLASLPSHSTTTPLSITPAASLKASPLILSPALPPIPAKLVEKILKGENLELKELLPDNVALRKKLDEVNIGGNPQVCALPSSSRLRDISDPLSWVFCYLSFMAVKTPNQETRDLIAYAQIIIELARKHPGLGWYTYDNLFRQQLNAGAGVKWNEVNPSLMAATVLASRGSEGSRICPHCMASDHSANECALTSLEPARPLPQSQYFSRYVENLGRPRRQGQVGPYPKPSVGMSSEPCRRFNRGACLIKPCKYEHWCNHCFRGPHSAVECPRKAESLQKLSEEKGSPSLAGPIPPAK